MSGKITFESIVAEQFPEADRQNEQLSRWKKYGLNESCPHIYPLSGLGDLTLALYHERQTAQSALSQYRVELSVQAGGDERYAQLSATSLAARYRFDVVDHIYNFALSSHTDGDEETGREMTYEEAVDEAFRKESFSINFEDEEGEQLTAEALQIATQAVFLLKQESDLHFTQYRPSSG